MEKEAESMSCDFETARDGLQSSERQRTEVLCLCVWLETCQKLL